jgi:hypothetical protein
MKDLFTITIPLQLGQHIVEGVPATALFTSVRATAGEGQIELYGEYNPNDLETINGVFYVMGKNMRGLPDGAKFIATNRCDGETRHIYTLELNH